MDQGRILDEIKEAMILDCANLAREIWCHSYIEIGLYGWSEQTGRKNVDSGPDTSRGIKARGPVCTGQWCPGLVACRAHDFSVAMAPPGEWDSTIGKSTMAFLEVGLMDFKGWPEDPKMRQSREVWWSVQTCMDES